jgi:hypothetical protein
VTSRRRLLEGEPPRWSATCLGGGLTTRVRASAWWSDSQAVAASVRTHRLRVGPHRLDRLAASGQVKPEGADLLLERARVKRFAPSGARLRHGQSFSLFLRFR